VLTRCLDGSLVALAAIPAVIRTEGATRMRIPTWRLVLTGGAITVLAVAGLGFAAASQGPSTPPANLTAAEDTPSTAPDARGGKAVPGVRAQRLLKLGKRLVHAEVTVTDKDGNLATLQLDHGTVTAVGGGLLTISEAGGGSETVSTNEATTVRLGRAKGSLGDVKVGAQVFVQSRIDGSTVIAKRILVVPAPS
jgi:hypothetical protein